MIILINYILKIVKCDNCLSKPYSEEHQIDVSLTRFFSIILSYHARVIILYCVDIIHALFYVCMHYVYNRLFIIGGRKKYRNKNDVKCCSYTIRIMTMVHRYIYTNEVLINWSRKHQCVYILSKNSGTDT